MRIAVLSETDPVETRVAATPDMVKKYKNLGADVVVQAGAGGQASISDAEFEAVGATIAQNAGDAVKDADIVLKVRRPADGELNGLKKGALVIGIMDPYGQDAALKALADAGASAFAMELMPRITRAQVMDDWLTAALMPFRNRDAAFALATFLGRFWSTPNRLLTAFPIDRRELADHVALGLTEARVRGAIRTLEEAGFLDRAVASGSTHKPTPNGLRRKPVLFMFGAEYGPLFSAANKRAAAARERRSGAPRPTRRGRPRTS
jgi:hypothetical protein